MQIPEGLDQAPIPGAKPHGLRDVPWRWSDLALGFAPLVAARGLGYLAGSVPVSLALGRLWLVLTLLFMTWMLVFPLRVARRRVGVLAFPTARGVFLEGLFAALAVPITLASVTVAAMVLTSLLGYRDASASPVESIAASPDRFDRVALVVLGVAVAPLAEEVFFRGMLHNALRQRFPLAMAAPAQALAFALGHPYGVEGRVQVAVIGLILGLLYEWRRRLAAPIILHSLVGGLALVTMFAAIAAAANAPVLGVAVDPVEGGCRIMRVQPGGAAEEAGLRVGDVIQAAGEYSVANQRDLVAVLGARRAGDRIPVWYLRDGEPHQVDAVLKARPR